MNIIITHSYSLEQKGDSSLLVGTIKQLQKAFPAAHIEAQIMERTWKGELYEGVPVMDSIILIALANDVRRPWKTFAVIYRFAAYLTWAWIVRWTGKNRKLFLSKKMYTGVNAIYEADLVIPVSGGYINGDLGRLSTANLIFILLPLWIAHTLRRPVIHFPQSIGPLTTDFQRFMVSKTITKAKLIMTRESVSADFVKKLGVDPAKIKESIDVGFLFDPAKDFHIESVVEKDQLPLLKKKLVGITTKMHLSAQKQARYERELALFADWLCKEKNMTPVFIPQITSTHLGEDDRVINRRIHALMKERDCAITVEKNITNHETKALIDHLDYMVGTRFHSVIFALSGYVPSIAIEYHHKTTGIMRDLDLERWIIQMRGMTAVNLETLFMALMSEEKKYREHLKMFLPGYLTRAANIVDYVRNTRTEPVIKKMNIFYITDVILDDRIVHAAHVDEVSKNLAALGNSVTLYAPLTKQFTIPKAYPIRFISTPSWLVSGFYQFKLFFQLRRDIRHEHPDIIYVRQSQILFMPTIVSKFFSIPLVIEVNGKLIEEASQIKKSFAYKIFFRLRMVHLIERFNLRNAKAIIVVSSGIKTYLLERYNMAPEKITVIPNAVDAEVFKPLPTNDVRSKLNLDNENLYVGYIGSLHSWQGVPYLVDAAKLVSAQHPNVKFLIIGDGGDAEKITTSIQNENLTGIVELRKSVIHDLIPEYINALDICISYPLKIRSSAASPFKVYEYLACGKPVIVSDIGGIKEEFGSAVVYCEPESGAALATVITSLIDNAAERKKLSIESRAFIENGHSWRAVAETTIEVCERAALR